jgi:integrase
VKGHIRKQGGRYYVVVELDRDPITGKRHRVGGGGFARKKDAQAALAEVIRQQQEGEYVQPSRQTVAEHLGEWLPAIRATVAPKTWESYRQLVESYVIPRIGSLFLRRLTPGDLNRLYDELLANGRKRGGGLSRRTVRYVHAVMHRALKDAVRWGKLTRNVADLADPPRPRRVDRPTWDAHQIRGFLEHVAEDRLWAAWVLMLSTGMRRGEVLGLRWQDVDLDTGSLSVRQTLINIDYEMRFSEPKTPRSRRAIALDRGTVKALREHRERQLEESRAWGPAWMDTGLVFTREDGLPIHPDRLKKLFERQVMSSGLPRVTLHGLRHSHASLALKAGIHPKIVSERLGHSSTALTMDVYSHVLDGMQQEAAGAIGALLFDAEPAGDADRFGS